MELSKAQLNYILAIKQLAGGKVTQKYICEYLGVKKSTASIALKNLEENGYINKSENNYILTEKSWEILNQTDREKFEFMSLFNGFFGIDKELCEDEYKKICGSFSKEFIDKLTQFREREYNSAINKNNDSEKIMNIDFGKYEIPFQVVQSSGETRSMGDKGFYHPATLVVEKDCQYIVLKSKEIYYKSKTNQILKGKLQELYYLDTNMAWVLSKQKEESNWIIPLKEILYQKDDFEKASVGVIKIKVAATTMKMPESIAEITFNFKLLKKIAE